MKKILLLLFFAPSIFSYGQILYDPTVVYDPPTALYDDGQITTLELNFYDPNYHATLKSWKENYIEDALPAKLQYGAIYYDSVAVKYKGNSTFAVANLFNNPKVPYNIDINDIVSGQNIHGYKKLKLGNALFDPTFAKEMLASSIYKQYVPTFETALLRLIVNDDYLGVYVNQEDVGRGFLKKHFDENGGPFFKCEPMTEEQAGHPVDWPDLRWRGPDTLDYFESYERKSPTGWTEFLNFINTLNNNFSNIEQVLNIDRVLWNFAVNQVLSNEDTYNTTIIHNYYMYQTADGKFQMLPWDLTESFCGLLFTQGSPSDHYNLNPLYGLEPYFIDRPLVYQLLGNNYYRKRYFAHIRTVMNENYTSSVLKSWIQSLQSLGFTAIQDDPNKMFNMTQMVNNIDSPINWLIIYTIAGVTHVVNNRKPYLLGHPDVAKVPPVISNVSQNIQHPSNTETVYITAQVSNATTVKLRATNNPAKYASNFPSILMHDDGLNGDATANDQIYTAQIPFNTTNDHIKYYIEAENAEALALMPERAEYFYYHYYIDQVVSTQSNFEELEVSVYPNPTNDFITVALPNNLVFDLTLYALNGAIVLHENEVKQSKSLDLTGLAKGFYTLEIKSDNFKRTEKIVLN